jgi:hypothetical protein
MEHGRGTILFIQTNYIHNKWIIIKYAEILKIPFYEFCFICKMRFEKISF